ncbi:MAG TPA: hypothetical protein VHM92_03485 [Allosphingosinicella sp.]|nr:hypothetical protein [Allosphingosinicella sp.]
MSRASLMAAAIAAFGLAFPGPAGARKGPPPEQVKAWGACAALKNADEVAWLYILETNQSRLQGPLFYGAGAHAIFLAARECVPEGTAFDNKLIKPFTAAAIAAWGKDRARHSQARAADAWADCMADKHPEKAGAYLFARDVAFGGGPKVVVQGVDALEAVFAPTADCDGIKPASVLSLPWIDLYARFNYRIRIQPRMTNAVTVPPKGSA